MFGCGEAGYVQLGLRWERHFRIETQSDEHPGGEAEIPEQIRISLQAVGIWPVDERFDQICGNLFSQAQDFL